MPAAASAAAAAGLGDGDRAASRGSADDALASLIQPLTAGDFLGEHWPAVPLTVHGPVARLPEPFTHLAARPITEFLASYRGRVVFGRGSVGPRAVLSCDVEPQALYAMGLTLYLPDVEALVPGATAFTRELEAALGLPAGVARFTVWTSPVADGAACHFDAEDVFSVQIAGRKRFSVSTTAAMPYPIGSQFGPGIPLPADFRHQLRGQPPSPDDCAFEDVTMEPGSVLYLPRGFWHRTAAETDSLSVTIAIAAPALLDVALTRLREVLLADPAWRRPAGGAVGDEARALAALLPTLTDAIARLDR